VRTPAIRIAGLMAAILLCAGSSTARGSIIGGSIARAQSRDPHPPIELLGKPQLLAPPESGPRDALGRDGSGYDCIEVNLDLQLDFVWRTIRGRVTHTIEATEPLSAVQMSLADSMHVVSVRRGQSPAAFRHANSGLAITCDPPLAPGERADFTITYHGAPQRDGFLGFAFVYRHGGVPAAYTLDEPKSASSWWPCKESPSDKVLSTVTVDLPDSLYLGSNGRLVADVPSGSGRHRMTWRESFPIAPYLISLACTNYAVFGDTHIGPNGQTLPILYLAYPEHRDMAAASWANTPRMISAFEDRFGPYPFYGEKYGMAEFVWGGGMEHQTLTSYGEYLIDGTDTNDWVVAHELAHQWWGDMVTCGQWEDIWLNEGFASYAEALWYESIGGIEGYRDWMRGMWDPAFLGPIVPPRYMFGGTVYHKGAWVLHMLRGLLGDSIFFEALRTYGEDYAYGSATTEDLVRVFEKASGRNLRWFFDQWVYQAGQPAYVMTWAPESRPDGSSWLRVRIEQGQIEPPYRMPLEVEIRDGHGSYREVVQDSLRVQEFLFAVRTNPTDVRLDPDDWVLKYSIGGSDVPPPNADIRIELGLPRPSPGGPPVEIPLLHGYSRVTVNLYDITGMRIAAIRPTPGMASVLWDGRDDSGRPVASGLYFARTSQNGQPVRICLIR
jgi:aminopeptidase N